MSWLACSLPIMSLQQHSFFFSTACPVCECGAGAGAACTAAGWVAASAAAITITILDSPEFELLESNVRRALEAASRYPDEDRRHSRQVDERGANALPTTDLSIGFPPP